MATSNPFDSQAYRKALEIGRPPNINKDSSAVPKIIWSDLSSAMKIFVIGILILLFIKGGEVYLWGIIKFRIPTW